MNETERNPEHSNVGRHTVALKRPVSNHLVLIDGITRAGKLLLGRLASQIQRVDYFMHSPIFEHIATLWRLGLIEDGAAASMLQLNFDVQIYDRMIGRNLNFRSSDSTFIGRAPEHHDYLRRSEEPEGQDAMVAFNDQERMPLFLTHELLPQISICFAAVPHMKVIELERHPVDLAHSWYRRGWGDRFGEDPLAFTPVVQTRGSNVPWFALKWSDQWSKISAMERCVASVMTLIDECAIAINRMSLGDRNQIMFLAYEALMSDPRNQLDQIARFLGTECHESIDHAIVGEGLPNQARLQARTLKFEEIGKNISAESFARLKLAAEAYEERWS